MNRYSAYGPHDETALQDGDDSFAGVDMYNTADKIAAGLVQEAINKDFSAGDGRTRGGLVCIPELGISSFNVSSGWTARTGPSKAWQCIAYGNGRFVALTPGGGSDVMYSSDGGVTWAAASTTLTVTWKAVTFGNNRFVAVGDSRGGVANTVAYSADGVTWTAANAALAQQWWAITYGGGLFVAVSIDGTTQQVMTSPDGATWTARTTPLTQSGYAWWGVAYSSTLSLYVAVTDDGGTDRTMYSSDAITWTAGSSINREWKSICWGNDRFVAVADSGATQAAMYSTDGLNWTIGTTITPTGFSEWQCVAFGNNVFIAVSNDETDIQKQIMSSPNGVSWTAATAPTSHRWQAIAYGEGVFAAVAAPVATTDLMTKSYYTLPNNPGAVLASGSYSDPNDPGSIWTVLVGTDRVGFYAFGKASHTVNVTSGQTVSAQSTVVQANNQVFIFRGPNNTPLVWNGVWGDAFELATGTIPNATAAIYYQNRLWAIVGKDSVYASDVLGFTVWNTLDNDFNLSKGDSNYLVALYPFGDTSIIVFKNRSVMVMSNVDGATTDIIATEITRQVGAVGINSVVSVGPDLVYASDRNINLLSLTTTNNAVQHKTLPLSAPIRKILDRVNWSYSYKISLGYWDNKLYVALPVDGSPVCNAIVVHNFVTGQWFGEWNFNSDLGISVQGWSVANYLGLQRLHAVTEDGRIFVTDEGQQDISGSNVYEISDSMTSRAYQMDNNNRLNRRMWSDLSTWRPSFSVTAYVDGVSESTEILADQTYARSESWIFNDSTYTATNANDDYNRAGRKDYAGYCSDSIQCQSGFLPEEQQEYRFPIITRRKGRLTWFKIENTQGAITIKGLGGEARAGDRGSLVQVM